MAEGGPSPRARSKALTALAASAIVLPVVALTAGSLGLLPSSSEEQTLHPVLSNDQASMAAFGASGILPETDELSASVLETIAGSRDGAADSATRIPDADLGIPPVALTAYHRAEEIQARQAPGCKVSWTLLAALGRVISDHGDGNLDASGTSVDPIVGPRLDGGAGLPAIPDTDGGRLDGDGEWDHAVGPMQILPAVWNRVGADSDGDGTASPHNVFDAALGAGRYLCEGGADLSDVPGQARAVFRYQHSEVFVRTVMVWTRSYAASVAAPQSGEPGPALPPVDHIQAPHAIPTPGPLPRGKPRPPAALLPPAGPPNGGGPPVGVPPVVGLPTTTPSSRPAPTTTPTSRPAPTTTPTSRPAPTTTPTSPPRPTKSSSKPSSPARPTTSPSSSQPPTTTSDGDERPRKPKAT